MKAVVYNQYGPPEVLQLAEVEKPVPADDEVLIKIRATTVTTGDVNMRGFTFVPPGFGFLPRLMFGLRQPRKKILGMEFAGDVEETGRNVTLFKKGDKVFGIDSGKMGAYAEYTCRSEKSPVVLKPDNISYEQAAAIPFGAHTALAFLRDKARLRSGQSLLITGASGCVGSCAVQLAKYYGAIVTGVCSASGAEVIKSLGADFVIDYTRGDFTGNGRKYDFIMDTVPGKYSFSAVRNSLQPNGVYLPVAGGLREMFQSVITSVRGGKKVLWGPAGEKKDDLVFLRELIEKENLKAVIDKIFPLEEMTDAHRYVDKGHKKGSVVITVNHK